MRLDVFLTEKGYCASRTESKGFIQGGYVSVDDKVITKPSFDICGEENISIDKSSKKYVSRGGLKLESALDAFNVNPKGLLCLDIGASSGGFTDCLLKRGAEHVIAVDSGWGQMAESLRKDPRVTVIENFNARYMTKSDFEYIPSLAVMDVSFISATLILPAIKDCLAENSDFICLIKPQFEVGKNALGKGGIVKDEKVRLSAIDRVVDSAISLGFTKKGLIKSPVLGGDGNIEYLAHFVVKNGR